MSFSLVNSQGQFQADMSLGKIPFSETNYYPAGMFKFTK
jgi:hypothetical protein